ncbi:MAG: hypothetical protein KAX84_13490 [Burkholderiales bacterium]|nr:hypothetical protein [Burkholderiales bacterium]
MSDSILNSALIAATLAAILFFAIDDARPLPQSSLAHAARVVTIDKTVVSGKRPNAKIAAAGSEVKSAQVTA